ncbi:ribonuclease H-like domain-containing protein [Cyathus striatus]|nr:ribonuclease H-like domain-containing protein [Cyathus striatus]
MSTYLPAEEVRAYNEDVERLAARESLTYLMDGWEDSMKQSVYGCLVSEVGEYPIILALKELTGIRATADNLVVVADEALTKKQVNSRAITAVCTDNPTTMQAFHHKWANSHSWILMSKDQLPCFIHGVNTIMGKVASFPSIKDLIMKNTKIVTFFNASHYWGENRNTESRFYAHKQILYILCSRDEAQRAVNELSPIRHDVLASVLEVEFIRICKPLLDFIGDTESRDITLADCMIQLIWAQREIYKGFLRHAKETVTHYFHAMNTELHWLALFLHPLCCKLAIISSVHSQTTKDAFRIALGIAEKWGWSRKHAEQLLKDIQAYANEELPFKGGKADAIVWWKSVIGFHPIQTFAIKMMSIVPHAAEVERFFSNLGGVQSVKRSQLTIAHLESLGTLRNHYNHQLHEATIAAGKDPHRHHAHMHITSKGIDLERADTLTDSFSIPTPLETGFEGTDFEGSESFALNELATEYAALEQSGFTTESGDGFSVAVPVGEVYDTSIIDIIRQGQLPSIQNSLPQGSQAEADEPWDANSLLSSLGM